MPPDWLVLLLIPVLLWLGTTQPLYLLLVADLVLVVFPNNWQFGGVWVDLTDIIFAALALGLIVQGWPRRGRLARQVPHLWLWVAFGVLCCLSYLNADTNQSNLSDPVRIAFQLYHWCWKPILYFPLAALLIEDRKQLDHIVTAFVFGGVLCALMALSQLRGNLESCGPFSTKNMLGGALVMPLILALSAALYAATRRRQWLYLVATLTIAKAVLGSGSRGAFIAAAAGSTFLCAQLYRTRHGRSRVTQTLAWVAVGGLLLFALRPDLLERPSVQRIISSQQGTEDETFSWRIEQRWPYFWEKALDHPLFGVGTEVDNTLGESGNTPHNGFLALAVTNGFPAAAVFLTFVMLGVRDGLKAAWRAKTRANQVLGWTVAAALIGLATHNIVEVTYTHAFAEKAFWLFTALTGLLVRRPELLTRRSPAVAMAGVRAAASSGRQVAEVIPLGARS